MVVWPSTPIVVPDICNDKEPNVNLCLYLDLLILITYMSSGVCVPKVKFLVSSLKCNCLYWL